MLKTNSPKMASAVAIFAALTTLSNVSLANENLSGVTKGTVSKPQVQESSDVEPVISNSIYLSQFSGIELAPKAGQVEAVLGANLGTMKAHYDSTATSDMNSQSVQVAAGLGRGFFIGGLVNFLATSSDNNGYSNKTSGAIEPQIALGFRNDLTANEKVIIQVSYAISTGASNENSNYPATSGGSSTGDSKRGGSFIIPAIQFETKSLLGMTTGIRAAYNIAGEAKYSSKTTLLRTDGSSASYSFNQTKAGGNSTSLLVFSQSHISNQVSIGGVLGGIFIEKSKYVTDSSFVSLSDGDNPGGTYGLIAINLPIKLASSIDLIPEVNYVRTVTDGGKIDMTNVGLSGKFSF